MIFISSKESSALKEVKIKVERSAIFPVMPPKVTTLCFCMRNNSGFISYPAYKHIVDVQRQKLLETFGTKSDNYLKGDSKS